METNDGLGVPIQGWKNGPGGSAAHAMGEGTVNAPPTVSPAAHRKKLRAVGLLPPVPKRPALASTSPLWPDLTELVSRTCQKFGLDIGQFAGHRRAPLYVHARMACVIAARMSRRYSFPEIARAMGRPNHSTVITAYRRGLRSPGVVRDGEELGRGMGWEPAPKPEPAPPKRMGGVVGVDELAEVAALHARQHPPRADYRRVFAA